MPDSSEIDAALSAKLLADPTLMGICSDGVYFDEASQGLTKFVIISLVLALDTPMFGARAFEDATYLVKAVTLNNSGADVKTAAARIDALLDNQPLSVSGYSHMVTRRVERIRLTEVDDMDNSIRWQHRGGRYEIVVSA